MTSLLCLALLSCVVVSSTSTLSEQPQVTISLGTLVGSVQQTVRGRDFYAFQGIPYAKPPVGKDRFKQSVPGGPWTGVYNATRAPNMCIQEVVPDLLPFNIPFDFIGCEDCLYLNVFTPKLPTEQVDRKLLDVIVYIHGGAFQIGASNIWGPLILLDKDVVLVTLNYRLGFMGFLSFEDNIVPGNNGLKDQTLALQWVQKHIASFGGDPNKVTISGMSAGGASVSLHLLSPLSSEFENLTSNHQMPHNTWIPLKTIDGGALLRELKALGFYRPYSRNSGTSHAEIRFRFTHGLFNKAISNSGSALNPWTIGKKPKAIALALAQIVGCPINDTLLTLRCLRERPAEHLMESVRILTGGDVMKIYFAPVVEPQGPNAFIDDLPINIIEANKFNDVPALFSYCDDEGSIVNPRTFLDEKTLEAVESNWDIVIPQATLLDLEPAEGKEVAQKMRKRFLGDKTVKESARGYSQMFGERFFVDGIQKTVMLQAERQTSPVYSYRFSFASPSNFSMLELPPDSLGYTGGASHGSDNSYLFDAPYLKPIKDFPELMVMSETMTDVWMKFILEDPVSGWSPAKSGLPKFTFLDIKNPSENKWRTEETVGQQFWDSLNLPQPNSKSSQNDQHSEL